MVHGRNSEEEVRLEGNKREQEQQRDSDVREEATNAGPPQPWCTHL